MERVQRYPKTPEEWYNAEFGLWCNPPIMEQKPNSHLPALSELDLSLFEVGRREDLIGERSKALDRIAILEAELAPLRTLAEALTMEIARGLAKSKYAPPTIEKFAPVVTKPSVQDRNVVTRVLTAVRGR